MIETIDRLLLLGGPMTSGKSTLIDRLRTPGDALLATLDLDADLTTWRLVKAQALARLDKRRVERMILHVALPTEQRGPEAAAKRLDEIAAVLASANEITCLTLWAPPAVLEARLAARRAAEAPPGNENNVAATPAQLLHAYERWFDLLGRFSLRRHSLIDTTDGVEVLSLDDWPRLQALTSEAASISQEP